MLIFSVCLIPLNMPSLVATLPYCSPHQDPHILLFFNDARLEEGAQPQKYQHVTASIYWRLRRTSLAYLILSFVYSYTCSFGLPRQFV